MKRSTIGFMSATALLVAAPFAAAEQSDTLADAIKSGKAGVSVRARYENVDQDGVSEKADALTARLRLNYKTGSWNGWSAFAEYDHVLQLLSDYNSGAGTSPDKGQYPVVADPKGSDLNQLYIDYRVDDASKLRLGRQRILLDNQRFVGGVGWRQNEQTYDGLTFTTTAIQNTTLQYSYIGYVRRIFGQTVAAGKNNVDTHLLNAKVALNDSWSLTPYYYRIDNQDVPAFSTATAGARLTGGFDAGDNGKFKLAIELATQSDIANNPVSYDAEYALVDASWAMKTGLTLGLAYESLGGDANTPGASFRTPLATLHAFQGWADKFLATPGQGINDLFATVKFKAGKWNLTGVYHDFSSEAGSGDYGTEFDLAAGTKLGENCGLLFKGAFFSADTSPYTDTNKIWIMFTANY
ncbi:MAG: alginate export family protein [Gammaproteobacteria bacterium]|nr:alginate export family protein [Gammaproteobacteria bacterium]NNL50308.1 alginate export family protein [Woeseiaceae bacterium]